MSKREFEENVVSIIYMNDKVMELDNEYTEEIWLMYYPDGANLEDIADMARDAEMVEILRETYIHIMKTFK